MKAPAFAWKDLPHIEEPFTNNSAPLEPVEFASYCIEAVIKYFPAEGTVILVGFVTKLCQSPSSETSVSQEIFVAVMFGIDWLLPSLTKHEPTAVPVIPVFITGLVSVLLVSVCVSVVPTISPVGLLAEPMLLPFPVITPVA